MRIDSIGRRYVNCDSVSNLLWSILGVCAGRLVARGQGQGQIKVLRAAPGRGRVCILSENPTGRAGSRRAADRIGPDRG